MGRLLLGAFFLAAGSLHFLTRKLEIVYASGVAEIAGGALVLPERTRRAAGWWLIATLVAVFPANVNMAVHAERFRSVPEPLLWARLPVQALLIAWVWRVAAR